MDVALQTMEDLMIRVRALCRSFVVVVVVAGTLGVFLGCEAIFGSTDTGFEPDPPGTDEVIELLQETNQSSGHTDADGKLTLDTDSFNRDVVLELEDESGSPAQGAYVSYHQQDGVVALHVEDPTGQFAQAYYVADILEEAQSSGHPPTSVQYSMSGERAVIITSAVIVVKIGLKAYAAYNFANSVHEMTAFHFRSVDSQSLTHTTYETTVGEFAAQIKNGISAGTFLLSAKHTLVTKAADLIHSSGSLTIDALDIATDQSDSFLNGLLQNMIIDGTSQVIGPDTPILVTVNHFAVMSNPLQLLASALPFMDGNFVSLVEVELVAQSTVVVDDDYNFQPDPTDNTPFNVVDTVPSHNATGVSPTSGVVIFFDDIVDPHSLSEVSVSVNSGQTAIPGTYTLSLSANGQNAIIAFSPYNAFPENSTIAVLVEAIGTDLLLDKGGNTLSQQLEITFTTGSMISSPGENLGFESGIAGWHILGSGGVIDLPYGGLSLSGSRAAAIATGPIYQDGISGDPIDDRYSTLTSGAIPVPGWATQLRFDYYFISSEFPDWIGSVYDDTVTLQISGAGGSHSVVLESINRYSASDVIPIDLNWGETPHHTGLSTAAMDVSTLGSEVSVSITITDVGDTAYPSMIIVDNFRFH